MAFVIQHFFPSSPTPSSKFSFVEMFRLAGNRDHASYHLSPFGNYHRFFIMSLF